MRWLLLFVLLVNVVYVSWELSQSTDESTVPKASTGIPIIELLSETGQATRISTEEAVASESTWAAKLAGPEKQQASTTTSVVTKSGADRCYTLGPFRELDNLREFTRAIKSYVIAASFRSREEQEQSMFWVYLEPASSLKAARGLGKRLKSMKIKDYYVINSGPQEKGISLGHFKEKDRAYAHAESVKKLGFKPVVEPVFRSYTIYWLDYRVPASKVIPQRIFTKHLTKKINRLDRSCS
jgi:hypothetical protein